MQLRVISNPFYERGIYPPKSIGWIQKLTKFKTFIRNVSYKQVISDGVGGYRAQDKWFLVSELRKKNIDAKSLDELKSEIARKKIIIYPEMAEEVWDDYMIIVHRKNTTTGTK